VKKILLTAAFSVVLAVGAVAQTSYPIPPRDPPFGKGIPDNNTEREPIRDSSPDESIPPRDPPFGKGELHNEPAHLPSSALTQGKASDSTSNGEIQKSAKSEKARTRSALKKDNAKNGAKQDSAPKSDTD
jgi:hypothetical protein